MPGILNPDQNIQAQNEMKSNIVAALQEGDTEKFANALVALAGGIQNQILQEAQSLVTNEMSDSRILAERGIRPLTSAEQKYYNAVINNEGFGGVEELVPATVINRVFDELEQSHPLLQAITFVNTTGVTKWITKNGDVNPAFWGKLTDAIKKKLDNGFNVVNTNIYKLSAYLPVAKSMLNLGPEWLDKYVRAVLVEACNIALETAIVSGTGKDEPIGMIKDLNGAVVDGVYPDKTATALSDLKPKSLGKNVMYPLTKNGKRKVSNVILVVNPADYWEKLFPATTVLTADGNYVYGVLPIPATIIESVAMPVGKMAAGVAADYFLGVGSSQKIEYSDEVKFIDDERVYATKMEANGFPVSNDSFLVFDISGIGTETSATPETV
ncbi:phage major capsid protein [Ureibacillus sp. 179-F W5.1 NHS]|uniref:phage major capsid protein n=1 Tax=Ureibacillus sp. 179-F W5.1 NHS TaxID=3374297 RepID=UPI0038794D86